MMRIECDGHIKRDYVYKLVTYTRVIGALYLSKVQNVCPDVTTANIFTL